MNEPVEIVDKQKWSFEDRHLNDEYVSGMMEFLSIDVDLSPGSSNREETLCSVSWIMSLMKVFFKLLLTFIFGLPQCVGAGLQIYMPPLLTVVYHWVFGCIGGCPSDSTLLE